MPAGLLHDPNLSKAEKLLKQLAHQSAFCALGAGCGVQLVGAPA